MSFFGYYFYHSSYICVISIKIWSHWKPFPVYSSSECIRCLLAPWKCLGKWLFYAYSSKRAPWCFTVVCQASICSCHMLYKVALSRVPFLYSKKSIRELGLYTINNQTNSTIFNDEICFLNYYHFKRDLAISHCSAFSFLLKNFF